jgi:hypothetical protein
VLEELIIEKSKSIKYKVSLNSIITSPKQEIEIISAANPIYCFVIGSFLVWEFYKDF